MVETILVTGGAGAIGCNLSNRLRELGNRVIVLDDLSSGNASLLNKDIAFIKGSVTDDDDLAAAFSEAPAYVFHLAALFANQNSVDHPQTDITVNGLGTIKVLEYAQRHRVKKLLYSSSSCVYGSQSDMREENVSGCTDTPYAITKFLGEKYCRFWSNHHGLDTVIVRLFNSYGPGEFPGRYRNVIPNFFALALEEKPLTITGSGDEIRDFNFVGDTVQGIIRSMYSATTPGDVYNLASGAGTRVIDLARMINEISGNSAGIVFQARRPWDFVTKRIGIVGKAKNNLGYAPETGLKAGLETTYNWMRSCRNRNDIQPL